VRIRQIDQDAALSLRRGDVIVCISARGLIERVRACLQSVLAHTPHEVPLLLWDAPAALAIDGLDGDRELLQLRGSGSGRALLALTAPSDIALLRSDAVVASGWLEALRAAADADSRIATATAISSDSAPSGWTFEDAAAAIRAGSQRLRPVVTSAAGPCRYVRRGALELVGEDVAASAASDEQTFSRRCIERGLINVLADDVLVGGTGGYGPWNEPAGDQSAATARVLHGTRRALSGLSVIVDARILAKPTTGTQIHILELLAALSRAAKVRVSALVPSSLGEELARELRALPGLTLVTDAPARGANTVRADIVHRPYQVDNPGELAFLTNLADRLAITHQDLIGYHNPTYFGSPEAWLGYRELTRTALAIADRVLLFSAHTRDEALAEELVEPDRASVVHIGTDHRFTGVSSEPSAPPAATGLPADAEMLLCIGNDYRHKNRPFALRMLEELRDRHDWGGRLVLAGPHVENGSSAREERVFLAQRPQLAQAVLDLGPISEGEKAWLLARAQLVLYPTVHEGFGLVPFEAADSGAPCMWAAGTSLSELLGDEAASILPWDPQRSADRALELLRDERERARNLEAILTAGSRLSWDETAARLIAAYRAACDAPSAPAAALYRRGSFTRGQLSEDGARLIGPGGALPADVERPLLALATNPRVGRPVFGAFKLGYRASRALRRWVPARVSQRRM
jgi:glycosyltransferase involved in cell wall biosynthesis